MPKTITLPTTADWYSAIMDHWRAKHDEAVEWQQVEGSSWADSLLKIWVSYDEDAEGSPFVLRFDESMEATTVPDWGQINLAHNPHGKHAGNDVWDIARLLVASCSRWAKKRGIVS